MTTFGPCTATRATRSSTRSSVTDLVLEKPTAQPGRPDITGVPRIPVPAIDIEARAVAKRFGETPIFSDVSFRLARGQATALVGANGAGQSTLLPCLMGLDPAL